MNSDSFHVYSLNQQQKDVIVMLQVHAQKFNSIPTLTLNVHLYESEW